MKSHSKLSLARSHIPSSLSLLLLLLQADLPSMADPRLWMLGCKDGAEAEIMVSILNKYIAQVSTKHRL